MKELGITKGKYRIRKSGQELFIDTPTMEICRSWSDSPKYRKHFELFCDAGNTAQKCGLLPSELLRQWDELREVLKLLMAGVTRLPPLTGIHGALENQYKIAEAAIKNTCDSCG